MPTSTSAYSEEISITPEVGSPDLSTSELDLLFPSPSVSSPITLLSEQLSPPSPTSITSTPPSPRMSFSMRTPAMMPSSRAKEAPRTFTGKYEDVRRFIDRYNNLCSAYNVPEPDKCKRILDYCARKVIHLIEGLQSYADRNWSQLEADLLRYYDADLRETRYVARNLRSLAKKWRNQEIRTLTKWKKYECKFITIGGWLKQKGKISDSLTAEYFWKGINKRLKEKIENRLLNGPNPPSLKVPFPMDEVIAVVEKLFERDRFDYNLADSDTEEEDSEDDDSDSGSESDTESEEEDKDKSSSRKHKQKKYRSSRKSSDTESEDDDEPVKAKHKSRKVAEKPATPKEVKKSPPPKEAHQDDVEILIKQMGRLSIDDPKYGLLYYKAIKLDKMAVQCIAPPRFSGPCHIQSEGIHSPTQYGHSFSSTTYGQRSFRLPPPHEVLWVWTTRSWIAKLQSPAGND
jgi:Cobalamin biosynthesis protein CobT (nicotinate-mononucleotide:5, 6-dimethylbenzimidazole phosphoribosyltransferase)